MKRLLLTLLTLTVLPFTVTVGAEMHTMVGVGGTSIAGEWSTTGFTGFNTTLMSKEGSKVFLQTGYTYIDEENDVQATETWTMVQKELGIWNLSAAIGSGVSVEFSDSDDIVRTGLRGELSYTFPTLVEVFAGYKQIATIGPDWKTLYGGLNLLAF